VRRMRRSRQGLGNILTTGVFTLGPTLDTIKGPSRRGKNEKLPCPGPAVIWTRKDKDGSHTKRNNSSFLELSFLGKVFRRGGKLYFQSLDFEGTARSRRGRIPQIPICVA